MLRFINWTNNKSNAIFRSKYFFPLLRFYSFSLKKDPFLELKEHFSKKKKKSSMMCFIEVDIITELNRCIILYECIVNPTQLTININSQQTFTN